MGDVGKGTAVDEGRRLFQCLYQVGLQRVFQQGGHSAFRLQIMGGDGLAAVAVTDDDAAQPGLQIGDIRSQAQGGHHFRSHGDVIAVFTGHAVGLAAQAVGDKAELAVIHIHTAAPGDAAGVDLQGVALVDVVVDHSGQQVVGGADGVEITGEVQVDVFHRNHLGIAAAGRAAFDAEHRTQRGLAQGDDHFFAQAGAVRHPSLR